MKDRTTEYAKLVVNGKKVAGRKEILACKRHLEDMKRKKFDYKFDVKAAERAIDIANTLTISEGEKHTQLKTRGFQNFIIGSLFGWKEKRTNKRRFREAYIQVGRQNGKSLLSGAIANYFATFGGYMLGRIFCVAPLSLDTKVMTTKGFKTMGNINIGDYVYTETGEIARVEALSPIVNRKTYEVKFDDGSVFKCTDNHLWTLEVREYDNKKNKII